MFTWPSSGFQRFPALGSPSISTSPVDELVPDQTTVLLATVFAKLIDVDLVVEGRGKHRAGRWAYFHAGQVVNCPAGRSNVGDSVDGGGGNDGMNAQFSGHS